MQGTSMAGHGDDGETPGASGTVAWLHLSDLHMRGEPDWERDVVLRDLRRDLPGLAHKAGIEPQLLFVTGDVAWSGAPREYEAAQQLLDALGEALRFEPRERAFVVPGNHDVDRGQLDLIVAHQDKVLAMDDDGFRTEVGRLVTTPRLMRSFGERLHAYCDHTARVLGPARAVVADRPWRSDVVEFQGIRVGVASMCSAWMCGPDDDSKHRRIVLGEAQARELAQELEAAGAHLRIALLHHPLDWLHEAEEGVIAGVLRRSFDVVLHGHRHRSEASRLVTHGGGLVMVEAGAAYAGSGWYHGCSLGHWDAARGELRLVFLTWDEREGGRWRIDSGQGEDGVVVLPVGAERLGDRRVREAAALHVTASLVDRLGRAVARVHGQQGFLGLPDSAPRPHASLGDVFVPQELRASSQELHALEMLLPRWLGAGGAEQPAARVVVLGDPGSGKSTLARFLALRAVEQRSGLVPLLLTVRDWVREGATEGLLAMAARQAATVLSIPATEEQLGNLCARGAALLVVDGLDEVSGSEAREGLRARIQGFAASHPAVPVIATSRVVGYDDAPLDRQVFETFALEPFDDPRQDQFIERWYAVAEPNDPSERARKRAELIAALEAEPRARQLARNPLLATLIALVHHHQAELPGRRARLYELVVELMLVTWPAARSRKFDEIDSDRQRVLLERLALHMQMGRGGIRDADVLVRRSDLERMLARLVGERFSELDPTEAAGRAKRWLRWLEASSGLLVEQQPGRCGFLHLSIMEYMAGRAVLRETSAGGIEAVAELVVMRHEDAAWWETLLLMLGSEADDRRLVTEVALRLLEADVAELRDATRFFLLSMLREEVDVDAGVRGQILDAVVHSAAVSPVGCLVHHRPTALFSNDFVRLVEDVACFGRRHGAAVREWLDRSRRDRSRAAT
jgi:UDP-2,3-diacylglucosamine pyrophosphatase LpxH